MKNKIKRTFLFFILLLNPFFLCGDDGVHIDTIELGSIRVNNRILKTEFGLFTEWSNIENFSNILTNIARYYPAELIPFHNFDDDIFFISIHAEHVNYVFLDENSSEDIFIERVEPNDDIILTIQDNEFVIQLNKQTQPSDLGKYFKNSYSFFLKDKNIFQYFYLKVINEQQHAYLSLSFKNNYFVDMFLLKELAIFTDQGDRWK
ncbi:MAG: hypothetical protein LBL58_19045 [Tannerellaceae bacterium]|jgi:hypothetical protein|nr:hypothetical protein [Tannerellaceae bacterium]